MIPRNLKRLLDELPDQARVLDVGGWAAPLNRADAIIDLMPYATRGALGYSFGPGPERFSAASWVQRDICDRTPWPFADGEFDFAVCVTTLEDVRDPVGVCAELCRVARAGYVEVPTVLSELIHGVADQGPWLGCSHHRWLCEIVDGGLVFTHKPHSLHADRRLRVRPHQAARMTIDDHLQGLFWAGSLPAREEVIIGEREHAQLAGLRELVANRFPPTPAQGLAELAWQTVRRAWPGPRRAPEPTSDPQETKLIRELVVRRAEPPPMH